MIRKRDDPPLPILLPEELVLTILLAAYPDYQEYGPDLCLVLGCSTVSREFNRLMILAKAQMNTLPIILEAYYTPEILQQFPGIERLCLVKCQLTSELCACLPNLKELYLDCGQTEAPVALMQLPNLHSLNIRCYGIGNELRLTNLMALKSTILAGYPSYGPAIRFAPILRKWHMTGSTFFDDACLVIPTVEWIVVSRALLENISLGLNAFPVFPNLRGVMCLGAAVARDCSLFRRIFPMMPGKLYDSPPRDMIALVHDEDWSLDAHLLFEIVPQTPHQTWYLTLDE